MYHRDHTAKTMPRLGARLWLGLVTCAVTAAGAPLPQPALFEGNVHVHGSLRAMLHENQFGSQIDLATLPQSPHLFGLGALADLAGEVLVLEGRTYVSYPNGAHAATTEELPTASLGAALLVTTQVEAWDGFVVEAEIAWEDFEATLRQWVERLGWDTQQRLPFQIIGRFPELQWHVIDGSRLQGGGGSHEQHLQAASRLQAQNAAARIVGFYSLQDQGVFTHRDAISHLHCLTSEPQQMGHVDRMVVPAGARVLFPAQEVADAVRVVDAMLDALGTDADRDAITSLTTEAECSGPSGPFTTRTRSIRPDRVAFEQISGHGTTRVWSLPDGNWGLNDAGEVLEVPAVVRAFVRGHEFHLQVLEMRERFAGFRLLGAEERDAQACQRIAMHDAFGHPATLLVRDEDHQLLELVLHPPGAQGAIVIVPHVWKERDGVLWFRGFVLTEGADRVFRYRYTHIEPNSVEASIFERPQPGGASAVGK
jgi:acetolactate decarboxylase